MLRLHWDPVLSFFLLSLPSFLRFITPAPCLTAVSTLCSLLPRLFFFSAKPQALTAHFSSSAHRGLSDWTVNLWVSASSFEWQQENACMYGGMSKREGLHDASFILWYQLLVIFQDIAITVHLRWIKEVCMEGMQCAQHKKNKHFSISSIWYTNLEDKKPLDRLA